MNRALLAGAAITLGVGGCLGLVAFTQDDCNGPESCVDEIKPAAVNLPDHTGTGSQWVQAKPPPKGLDPAGLKDGPEPEFYRKWTGRKIDGLPPLDDFARVSDSEVWGIQESPEELGPDGVQRWDGREWQATTLPEIPLPKTPKGHEPKFELRDIAAASRHAVWAVGDIQSWVCCMQFNHHDTIVLRWNGAAWQRQNLHLRGTQLTAVAPDGRGGAWVGTDRRYLLHTDEQGRWTKITLVLPTDGRWGITRLINVPGSTAMWAIAADDSDGGVPNRTFRLTG